MRTLLTGANGEHPRVLRVVQEYLPRVSGPANLIAGSSRALARLGWETEIFTCDLRMDGAMAREDSPGVTVRRFYAIGPMLSSYLSPRLIRAVHQSRHDVVHIHGFRNLTTDLSMLIARRRSFVFQPHGMLAGFKQMLGRGRSIPYSLHDLAVGRRLATLPAVTVVSTRLEREDGLRWGIPAERLSVIPEGVDEAFFAAAEHSEPKEPFRLLFVGRLSRDRNVETLIRAVAHVRAHGIDVQLRIVGRAAESSVLNSSTSASTLRDLCRTLGVERHVELVGELTGHALVAEFEAATLFVYAALYDSFGQALAQAAAAGLPIVSTPVGVATEIIRDGESGWLAGADPGSFGPVLKRVLQEPDRLNAAGRLARSSAARFRWPAVAAEYARLYTEMPEE